MVEDGGASSVVVLVEADEYKWTDVDTETLIRWRSANDCLFNGRRNAARKGFEVYVSEHGLVGRVEPNKVKRKWENLKQKYRELKTSRTGVGMEGEETTATSWKWFSLMDEALSRRHSMVSPVLVDASSIQDMFVVSPLSSSNIHSGLENQAKRRRNPDWVKILEMSDSDDVRKKLCQDREEVKERAALDREEKRERERLEREEKREEKRERERLEREEKREREWLEREERRERAWLEREEKREKERVDREERRELQWREWMDKRDKETAEREDRRQREFMTFIENVFKKPC
ncbi:trichohyalin-like [Cololabis saira]|uniref:trichohyalin-like n=1 Tax=Cololabis saira TaxID=129043 RepID=UPI002AD4DB88|nr:trichohyalin-like [Cololabis saira]